VICVPSNLHVSIARDVIHRAQPKALLIENPFCTDSKSGTGLIARACKRNISSININTYNFSIGFLIVLYTLIQTINTTRCIKEYTGLWRWREVASTSGGKPHA
jgi:hypothetical protein